MATLATLVVKLIGDVSGFSSSMDEASARLRSAGAAMTSAGAGLTAGVTLPLVGIGVAALHVAGKFEQSMNMMQAVSGATAEEMAQAAATAIALGSDLELPGTSAADAADAMTELSRAGLSVQESMDAARGVLQLSAAAQISNERAATITANALNTFGLAGTEAARVANLLAGGANASSAEIGDMAAALQMSGSVAASLGVPIEDLTTAIALMANAGISGSDAGTSLKTMLMRLGAPTAEASSLMRSLGISVFDANGEMLPMQSIIGQFSAALGGMSMEQRNAALATIFGADAIRAANVVLMGGTDAFDAMAAAVTAEGQAQALAAAQTAGFQGSLDGLRSAVETVLLTVAGPFLAMLTSWVQWLAGVVGQIEEMDPRLLNLAVVLGVAAAAIGPLLMVLGALTSGLGVAAGAVAFLLSPIGLVILAVAALAAAVVQHFGGVQATIQAASAFVSNVLAGLSEFVSTNQEEITGWVRDAWTQIQSIVTTLVEGVQRVISEVLTVVGTFIRDHGDEIKEFVRSAWQQIGEIVNLALGLINTVVRTVLAGVAQFISDHGDEIVEILRGAWTMIKSAIQIALDLIKGIIRIALALINGDWDEAWTEAKDLVKRIWESIKVFIRGAITYVGNLVRVLVDTVIQFFTNLYNRLVGGSIVPDMVNKIIYWFTQMRDRAVQFVRDLMQRGVALIEELKGRVLGILSDLVGGMAERGAGMVRAFADGVRGALSAALDAARELVRQIRDLLPGSDAKRGPLSDLTASGRGLPEVLGQAISRGTPAALGAVESLAEGMAALLRMDAAALGAQAGLSWIDALIEAIKSRLPALAEVVAAALEQMQPRPTPSLSHADVGGAAGLSYADVGGAPAASETRPTTTTINLYGPWQMSNEMDAVRVAEIVSEVLAGRATVQRRMNTGWAAV